MRLSPIQTIASVQIVASDGGDGGIDAGRLDSFRARRAMGLGAFMTRRQIEGRVVRSTFELLQAIPGVKVRQVGREYSVQSSRCSGGGLPGTTAPPEPAVFINGRRGTTSLADINPTEIEALEVFQGSGQMPAEAMDKCFAVFVWLRN